MPNVQGYQARTYVGEFDLSTYLTEVSVSRSRDTIDVTTMNPGTSVDHDKEFMSGMGTGEVSLGGLLDFETGASDEIIAAVMDGSEQVITVSPQGATVIGQRAKLVLGLQTAAPINMSPTEAVSFSSSRTGTGAVSGGIILKEHGQESSVGNSAGVDNAALTDFGAVGHLHVVEFDGTDATIKITDSVDEGVYADLISFTQVTDVTSERVAATGTVNRWARVELTGTFTTITFAVGFARLTQ